MKCAACGAMLSDADLVSAGEDLYECRQCGSVDVPGKDEVSQKSLDIEQLRVLRRKYVQSPGLPFRGGECMDFPRVAVTGQVTVNLMKRGSVSEVFLGDATTEERLFYLRYPSIHRMTEEEFSEIA